MMPKGKADWAKASPDHVLKASGFQISFYKGSRFLIFPVLQLCTVAADHMCFACVLLLYLPSDFYNHRQRRWPDLFKTVGVNTFFTIGFN